MPAMKLPPAVQQEYTAAQVWDELEPYFKKVGDAFATFTKVCYVFVSAHASP